MAGENKCKICRRAGEKLFLKGEKCLTPKCVFNKKPYPPGKLMSEKKHRSLLTEYGRQLREKQKVRNTYGVSERQFSNYVTDAISKSNINPTEKLYQHLELRLDNVIYRLGLAVSRALARQIVSHGHVVVNGKRTTIPSYQVRVGDRIALRENSRQSKLFVDIEQKITKSDKPAWATYNAAEWEGEIIAIPKAVRSEMPFDLASVIEFYRR